MHTSKPGGNYCNLRQLLALVAYLCWLRLLSWLRWFNDLRQGTVKKDFCVPQVVFLVAILKQRWEDCLQVHNIIIIALKRKLQ